MNQHNVSYAGAGRLAGVLCREMHNSGFNIDLVVSESEKRGRLLASDCHSSWSDQLIFPDSTEVIIVAVPDNGLKPILDRIICSHDTIVVHTAGSMGLDVFPDRLVKRGVFYPLQTFSANRRINFENLPVFIEASDENSAALLAEIADSIRAKKFFTDTEHRRVLHLAAVFVCNFANHMLTHGKELALKAGFSFEVLKPLIEETFLKALAHGPENSQTGPAVRNDRNTIEKHMDLLSFDPDLQKIYKDISGSITDYYNKL